MITIRAVQESDLETYFEHQSDLVAAEMAVFPSRGREEFMAAWGRSMANPDADARTVMVDGVVAGNVVCWRSDGTRHLGYWIGREFWGRGVATAAVRAYLGEMAERPIWALAAASNIGSQRVLEKNGFIQVERRLSPEDGVEEFVYRLD